MLHAGMRDPTTHKKWPVGDGAFQRILDKVNRILQPSSGSRRLNLAPLESLNLVRVARL